MAKEVPQLTSIDDAQDAAHRGLCSSNHRHWPNPCIFNSDTLTGKTTEESNFDVHFLTLEMPPSMPSRSFLVLIYTPMILQI